MVRQAFLGMASALILLLSATLGGAASIVWELEPMKTFEPYGFPTVLSGSIVIDSTHPNYRPGGTVAMGQGIEDFQFHELYSARTWDATDSFLVPAPKLTFGQSTDPADSIVTFNVNDRASGGFMPIQVISHDSVPAGSVRISYMAFNTLHIGSSYFRVVPEPAALSAAAIMGLAAVTLRRR
jgi:hypothetical protein